MIEGMVTTSKLLPKTSGAPRCIRVLVGTGGGQPRLAALPATRRLVSDIHIRAVILPSRPGRQSGQSRSCFRALFESDQSNELAPLHAAILECSAAARARLALREDQRSCHRLSTALDLLPLGLVLALGCLVVEQRLRRVNVSER